jgi:hypothetical protein
MAASNQPCDVKIVLANPEPSTHGTYRVSFEGQSRQALGASGPPLMTQG